MGRVWALEEDLTRRLSRLLHHSSLRRSYPTLALRPEDGVKSSLRQTTPPRLPLTARKIQQKRGPPGEVRDNR